MESVLSNRSAKLGLALAGVGVSALAIMGACAQPAQASEKPNLSLDAGHSITMRVGQTKTISAINGMSGQTGTYTWHEADAEITITPKGSKCVVKAIKAGPAQLSATFVTDKYRRSDAVDLDITVVGAKKGTTKAADKVTYKLTGTHTAKAYKATKSGKKAKSLAVAKTVKVKGATYKVTYVSKSAFKGCSKLTKLTIGSNVTKIGASAFSRTPKLKTLTVKSTQLTKANVKGALKGSSIKKVNVPNSKVKAYKKIFTKSNCGKKVKVY